MLISFIFQTFFSLSDEEMERFFEGRKEQIEHVLVNTAEIILDHVNKCLINVDNISMVLMDDADFMMNSQECWNNCTKLVEYVEFVLFFSFNFGIQSLEMCLKQRTQKTTMSFFVMLKINECPHNCVKYSVDCYLQHVKWFSVPQHLIIHRWRLPDK